MEIKDRWSMQVIFKSKKKTMRETVIEAIESYANLSSADLRYADLSYADLRSANLRYANLRYADLRYADLREIENYSESHDIFFELIRTEKVSNFKKSEWEIIGQLAIHYPCWDTIIKRFAKIPMTRIFKTLTDKGFGEYLEKYKKEIKEAK